MDGLEKYIRFEDVSLKVSDNGGFILTYTGIYKPKNAKPSDNVQRDWGRMLSFSENEADKAIQALQNMSGIKKVKKV